MIRLLADENFNGRIVRGLLKRVPDLDLVRAQDVPEIHGGGDEVLLSWAAQEERVLLTHDRKTVPRHAYDQVREGQPMPGVFVVDIHLPYGTVIEDLAVVAAASVTSEWEGQVRYLPL